MSHYSTEKLFAEFSVVNFIICAGPGAIILGDKCTCNLENTRFYPETNRCDCFKEINGHETGLEYKTDTRRCGCQEDGQFITPQGTSLHHD